MAALKPWQARPGMWLELVAWASMAAVVKLGDMSPAGDPTLPAPEYGISAPCEQAHDNNPIDQFAFDEAPGRA